MKPGSYKTAVLKSSTDDRVKIFHSQSVRQSHAFQSAEVTFGVEMMVNNNEKDIQKGIDRAEHLVEMRLVPKLDTHRRLLRKLKS